MSLSGDEMLMLEKWANLNLKPDFLAKIMLETADEMVNSKTAFPLTLHFLDRRINALKRRKAEF